MRNDVKVGMFLFIGFVLLFILSTQVGSFKNLSKEGYELKAHLKNAAGLNENSKVKANGLEVGFIKSLSIDNDGVLAKLFIYKHVKIPVDSKIKPIQESLLGGRYLEITLGKATEYLKPGDTIASAPELFSIQDASDAMTKAAIEFKGLVQEAREILTPETRENLRMTFANLEEITKELRKLTSLQLLEDTINNFNKMAKNLAGVGEKFGKSADSINEKLPDILANLDQMVKDLKVAAAVMKTKIPHLAEKFNKIEEDLASIIEQNRKPLNDTIVSADTFFSTGSNTFQKVEDLLDTIDKVKLEVAMRSEYMSSDEYAKGYLDLNYKPSDTKEYRFSVAGMDDYSRMDDQGDLIPPRKHESSKLLVSAQIAKRLDALVLRTGIIENTVGAGVDLYMLNDKLEASAEVFDFNAENDIRGNSPHAKISARYNVLKHLDFYGGYDNFLNEKARNAFVGMGIRFYDEDLKKLIMSQSLGAYAK
jgi:phospholipid/cholesterol/gamma-HCH transport system substrate-binding protein